MEQPEASGQVVAATYSTARDEIRTRIERRDQVAVLFLGGVSALVAVAVSPGRTSAGVLALAVVVVWLLSGGALSLYLQHNEVIGWISHYLKTEWSEANPTPVSHWDGSMVLSKNSKVISRFRHAGPYFLIVIPTGVISSGLCLLGLSRYHSSWLTVAAWASGCAICGVAAVLEGRFASTTEGKRNQTRDGTIEEPKEQRAGKPRRRLRPLACEAEDGGTSVNASPMPPTPTP